jgi:FAD/FMN-containing dehydrogenase
VSLTSSPLCASQEKRGCLLATRGGGHNGPGLGSCDDGLVVDLSTMKSVRGGYVSFMMDDELPGRLQSTYSENYARLAAIKAKYDPVERVSS